MAKGSGITKPMKISEEMQDFLGVKKASRGEIMKGIWKWIKKKGLQDKKDRRAINPDEKLSVILGKKQINMFKIAKKIGDHIVS